MIQLKKMPGDLEEAVRQREQEDAGTGGILLYGSSHFAVWREEWLTRQMAPYRLYNRAFGGSTAEEALYYYPRLVRPGPRPGRCSTTRETTTSLWATRRGRSGN